MIGPYFPLPRLREQTQKIETTGACARTLNDCARWSCNDRLPMATTLIPPDFREFLKLLNRRRVKYLIVGGYAVGFHGYPRPTGDIDIFIAVSPDNARAMVKVFRDFGFVTVDLSESLFLTAGGVARIGRPPVKIEVLNEIDGVEFDRCFASRAPGKIAGLKVNFIGLEDLVKNKRAAARPKDLADLSYLGLTKKRPNH